MEQTTGTWSARETLIRWSCPGVPLHKSSLNKRISQISLCHHEITMYWPQNWHAYERSDLFSSVLRIYNFYHFSSPSNSVYYSSLNPTGYHQSNQSNQAQGVSCLVLSVPSPNLFRGSGPFEVHIFLVWVHRPLEHWPWLSGVFADEVKTFFFFLIRRPHAEVSKNCLLAKWEGSRKKRILFSKNAGKFGRISLKAPFRVSCSLRYL